MPVLAAALVWRESQITTNGEPLGASFDTPVLGDSWGVCRGGDSPLGNGDPVSICIKIQAHHHRIHGGLSQSVTNFLSNLIPGGIIWVVSWWLWFIPTDKRGKAHPLCSGNNQRQKRGRDHHSFFGTKWCNFHETTPWHADRRQPRKTLSRKVLGKHTS